MNTPALTAPAFPAPPRPTAEATFRVRPRVDAADVLPRVALPSRDGARLWARVHAEGTPLIDESGDGGAVLTFVYRAIDGPQATAAVVLDRSQRVEAATCETSALSPLGDGVWALSLRVEPQWRGAYAFGVSAMPAPPIDAPEADRLAWWWAATKAAAPDPHAREQLDAQRSVASAPAALRSSLSASHPTEQPAAGIGAPLEGHPGFSVLVPATPPPANGWPVVLLLDGDRWLNLGIGAIAAELAGAGTPFLTLLHTPTDRVAEYTCSQDWVSRATAAISAVGKQWPVSGGAIVAGQSLGGLAAVHAQCAAPEVFAASISQSGSFWWSSHDPSAEGARWLTHAIAEHRPHLGAVWLEAGLREHDQADQSAELARVLATLPNPPRLHSSTFDGGHDWACWRAGLAEALTWALEPPERAPMTFPLPPAIDRLGGVPPHTPRLTGLTTHPSPTVEALREDPEAAEAFWADVEASGTPIVEAIPDSSDAAITFLWRGKARQVAVVLNKLTDPSTLREAVLEPIPGTDIWARTLRLGQAWRGSYSIAVEPLDSVEVPRSAQADLRRERSLAVSDPAQHAAINAWYDVLAWAAPDALARERSARSSVASGPQAPSFALPDGASPGRLVPTTLPNGSRGWWHVPAGPAPKEWDVRVLFDGGPAQASQLDAWIAAGLKRRVTLLVDSGDFVARVRDLSCSTEMIQALVDALDGADPRDFGAPLTRAPARTSIAGQSLGGLSALFAQCVAPQRFGASVCQSGSFWWPNVPASVPVAASSAVVPEWLTHAIATARPQLSRVHLEVGMHEWVLLDPTRRLRDVLGGVTERLHYREFDGGHDAACWEVQLPSALQALEA